ncbi:MAG TPA: ATP-binding protein, partial [Thermoplasmata archaeon]|nr:ATP-binding protein [Thermoplasmata archaeon]
DYDRISMHGVRRAVLDLQARAAELPLTVVEIPAACPNEVYERSMASALAALRRDGVERVVFGDLFLEEIRAYRVEHLRGTGIAPMFPLWGRPTDRLAREMIRLGIRAHVVCVDPRRLGAQFAGRSFDETFLRDLPAGVDPCGENGEFHTCVVAGPFFRGGPLSLEVGPVVERDGFVFADLRPPGGAGRRPPPTGGGG